MDPRRTVGAAQNLGAAASVFDAFDRIGERSTLEASGIGEHVGDGTVGEFLIVEWQDDIGQQDAIRLALDDVGRFGEGDAGALAELGGVLLDELFAGFCSLGSECLPGPGQELVEPGPLNDAQRRTGVDCIEHLPIVHDRDARALVLRQWLCEDGRSLEYEPFRRSHSMVGQRALEQLAGSTNRQPAEADQPASMMQVL